MGAWYYFSQQNQNKVKISLENKKFMKPKDFKKNVNYNLVKELLLQTF